jgi:hypothetical protein
MLEQMVKAGRLDRSFYTQLIFDSYATGNAVLVVGIAHVLRVLGFWPFFSLSLLLEALLEGLIGWILLALGVWLVGTKLLDGDAQLQTVIRLTGFAHVPLFAWILDLVIRPVGLWIAVAWFAAAVLLATRVVLGTGDRNTLISAGVGLLVWVVLVVF